MCFVFINVKTTFLLLLSFFQYLCNDVHILSITSPGCNDVLLPFMVNTLSFLNDSILVKVSIGI